MTIGVPKAQADINAVIPTPSSVSVAIDRSTPITIVWRLATTGCIVSPPQTFSSANATLNFGQASIAIGSPLNQQYPTAASVPPSISFTETISIPNDVVVRAVRANATLSLMRVFTQAPGCTFNSNFASIPLNITSSSAAGFSITRLALAFDNDAPVRVLERRRPLRAKANINFNGNGLMQGAWEIAGPTSTAGEPIYRPLATVQQYLTGGDIQRIESPQLPTDILGLYLIRLRVTDPSIVSDTPVIRYFVSDEPANAKTPSVQLGLLSPPNQIMLAPDTTFSWEPIRGARAYQLEIYAKPRMPGDTLPDLGGDASTPPPTLPPTSPVTGMLVAGGQTRTGLSATARSHLASGHSFLWRVLAIGNDGTVIGESPVRELRVP